jgi:hypothetical protein
MKSIYFWVSGIRGEKCYNVEKINRTICKSRGNLNIHSDVAEVSDLLGRYLFSLSKWFPTFRSNDVCSSGVKQSKKLINKFRPSNGEQNFMIVFINARHSSIFWITKTDQYIYYVTFWVLCESVYSRQILLIGRTSILLIQRIKNLSLVLFYSYKTSKICHL